VAAIYCRGLARQPHRPDWLPAAVHGGVVIGFVVACLYGVSVLLVLCLVKPDPSLNLDLHPLVIALTAPHLMPKLPLITLACCLSVVAWRRFGSRIALSVAAVVLAVGYQTLLCTLSHSAWYGQWFSTDYRRTHFIATQLAERRGGGRPPTVYWPTEVRHIWFDLQANSYFNWVQMSGDAFDRRTAIEGQRRARLVRNFELAATRKGPPTPSYLRMVTSNFFETDEPAPAPTVEDLLRLCEDPLLDLVVLEQEFEGLYTATDGKVFVYDCEEVRRRARQSVVWGPLKMAERLNAE
jgi:hypothetical protein